MRALLAALLLVGSLSAALPQAGYPVPNPNFVGGVDQTSAWSTYTPSLSCGAGTITTSTNSGRYKVLGKTIFLVIEISIATVGSCTGNLTIGVQGTANASIATACTGVNRSTGAVFPAFIGAGATTATAVVTPANQVFDIGCTYEQQ